jgi:ankyrin repeat protein
VLRRYPEDMYAVLDSAGNLFSTTIFVLVSAINKLSRCMDIPAGTLLYRGLGGTIEFPDRFTRPDEACVTPNALGFLEYGFMSTTADKSVAVQYSGVKQGKPKAGILQIAPNSVDRGADVSQFSQYPAEKEYLFVPYSFVQGEGRQRTEVADGGGVLTVVPVRVNINLKTETVEELKDKKKRLHLASARAILHELRCELEEWSAQPEAAERLQRDVYRNYGGVFTAKTLAATIIQQCDAVVRRHEALAVEDYVDDGMFRSLVNEMLNTKSWAKEKKELWMRDQSQLIFVLQGWSLRECHRLWQSYLKDCIKRAADGSEHLSAACLQLLISRGLVQRGARDEKNCDGEDVMVQAGGDGWSESDVLAAIAAGADIEAVDDSGASCVWNAARYGHTDCMAVLLAARCDANKCTAAERSPIFIAARNGHVDCIKKLIAARGDVNHCNNVGYSPVYVASQQGHSDCISVLLEAKADVNVCNVNGWSPIYAASQLGHHHCILQLVRAGGDVNKCDQDGWSPIYAASRDGHVACVSALVDCNGDVSKCRNDGASPVYASSAKGHAPCIAKLVALKADVNKCKDGGYSPLHIAVERGHSACVFELLSAGASLSLCNDDGADAVFVAAREGRAACLALLISSKADAGSSCRGVSALEAARKNSHLDCVGILEAATTC